MERVKTVPRVKRVMDWAVRARTAQLDIRQPLEELVSSVHKERRQPREDNVLLVL